MKTVGSLLIAIFVGLGFVAVVLAGIMVFSPIVERLMFSAP